MVHKRSRSEGPPQTAPSKSNIQVVVRIRPENQRELEKNQGSIVRQVDKNLLVFDPKDDSGPDFYYHGQRRKVRDLCKRQCKDMRYAFDHVFGGDVSNADVYMNTVRGLLDSFLDGFNCSVFAYGATGAGKTFTMLGSGGSPGVIFHTMMELYSRIEQMKDVKTCDVAVSYLEVYNEQIRDLLMPGDFLPLREDPDKGVVVAGLSLHKPSSADELLHMLAFGNRNRTQHPTDANAESSRSHAVFQVFVRQRDRTASLCTNVRVAKMSLIDLAGSERATVTSNRGARFREGANINRSLLALGNCINALADGKTNGYVPYRNSKLTRLLKDSLGGNCRTVMIAAVSPSSMSYEDSLNTLKYANRAKNIKADLKRNVHSVDFHVSQYAKIVEDLRREITELKSKLSKQKSHDEDAVNPEITRLKQSLSEVFRERYHVRRDLMEVETSRRVRLYKLSLQQMHLRRLEQMALSDPKDADKSSEKLRGVIERIQGSCQGLEGRRVKLEGRLSENTKQLAAVEAQCVLGGTTPEVLGLSLRCHHLEVEVKDKTQQARCLRKLCRSQEQHIRNTERFVQSLLAALTQQYTLIKASNIATSTVTQTYEQLRLRAKGGQEVVWADQISLDSSELPDTSLDTEQQAFHKLLEFTSIEQPSISPMTPGPAYRPLHTPIRNNTPRNEHKGRPQLTPKRPRSEPSATPRKEVTPSRPSLSVPPNYEQRPTAEVTAEVKSKTDSVVKVTSVSSTSEVTPRSSPEVKSENSTTLSSSHDLSISVPVNAVQTRHVPICDKLVSPASNVAVTTSPQLDVTVTLNKGPSGTWMDVMRDISNEMAGSRGPSPKPQSPCMDLTYSLLEGVCPLQATPSAPQATPTSRLLTQSALPPSLPLASNLSCKLNYDSPQPLKNRPRPNIDSPLVHSSDTKCSTMNADIESGSNSVNSGTITKKSVNSGTITKNSVNSGTITKNSVNSGTITKNSVNSGTITKNSVNSGAITAINSGTITKKSANSGTITVNSGTITKKSAPMTSQDSGNENCDPLTRVNHVARAMTFSPRPDNNLSFAEVVKSPVCTPSQLTGTVSTVRSPLISKENFPQSTDRTDRKPRKVTFASADVHKRSPQSGRQRNRGRAVSVDRNHGQRGGTSDENIINKLQKLGLPSTRQRSVSSNPVAGRSTNTAHRHRYKPGSPSPLPRNARPLTTQTRKPAQRSDFTRSGPSNRQNLKAFAF